jgi:preprotein translocase subunit YajC
METLFAQDAGTTTTATQGGGLMPIVMMVAIFAVFYFLLIRPQQKRQKELQRQIQSIKKGDEVVTAGGVKGKVIETKQDAIIVESEQTKLEIMKAYVAQVISKS